MAPPAGQTIGCRLWSTNGPVGSEAVALEMHWSPDDRSVVEE